MKPPSRGAVHATTFFPCTISAQQNAGSFVEQNVGTPYSITSMTRRSSPVASADTGHSSTRACRCAVRAGPRPITTPFAHTR